MGKIAAALKIALSKVANLSYKTRRGFKLTWFHCSLSVDIGWGSRALWDKGKKIKGQFGGKSAMMTPDNTNETVLDPSFDTSSVTFPPGTKLREIERIVILETLKQKNFNRTHTARALGIGIRTLQRKLKRYGASDWGLKTKVAMGSDVIDMVSSTPVAPEAPSLNN